MFQQTVILVQSYLNLNILNLGFIVKSLKSTRTNTYEDALPLISIGWLEPIEGNSTNEFLDPKLKFELTFE